MKVYMVMFDWSTRDEYDIEVEIFNTYKKAFNRFNEIIENEKNPESSWVGSNVIDKNGQIKEDEYNFKEHIETDGTQEYDCWWNISEMYDWYVHDFISLKILEVK